MHQYHFPAVLVEGDLEPAAIARIFERVNRLGMALGAFDLMVAKVYDPDWNLRDKWDEARTENLLIDRFLGEDGMPILQVIALLHSANIRESAVLDLERRAIHRDWDMAVAAVENALTFLAQRCGVLDPSWLPYRGMLIPLSGVATEVNLDEFEDMFRSWFWSRAFAASFDAAANTRLVDDYVTLKSAAASTIQLPIPPASARALYEGSRRRQGAAWRAFLTVLAYRDAKNLSGDDLGLAERAEDLSELGKDVVVTSLFQRGMDAPHDTEPPHLRTLSLALASRSSARWLRDKGVRDFFAEIEGGRKRVERALESQLLPRIDELAELDEQNGWQQLLKDRLQRLGAFLQEEAGQALEWEPDFLEELNE